MKNIYLIPTDKPSRLYSNNGQLHLDSILQNSGGHTINQHIYITSDEKLPYDSSIFDSGAFYHRDPVGDVHIITKHTFKPNPHFCKRIILTTDPDLIKDGVQAIDDEFLEWFVKNPNCESIEVEDEGCQKWINPEELKPTKHKYIWISVYKIIIPQEEPKQSSNFYEDLKKHFENTPREKLLEEWEKSAESDKVGPTVEEFLNNSKQETLEEAAEIWVNNRFTKQICGDESYPDIHASKEGIVESHILFTKCQAELFFKDDAIQTLEKGIAILLKRQEKMYSEEELKLLLDKVLIDHSDIVLADIPEWFENNKKK